jgi:dihydrofolate synthase/folylpolyglutamate synthase
MQRLRGRLARGAAPAELWLDGGHNPAAGEALAAALGAMPRVTTHLICGMLNTKDVAGFLRPLAGVADRLTGVSIPDEANTLPAEQTAGFARDAGMPSDTAPSVETAIANARETGADRILICGSLYLAGHVLRLDA